MSGYLPPVVMTIIADSKKFIDEQGRAVAAADAASKKIVDAAEKEAAAADAAAKKSAEAVAKKAQAYTDATAKTEAALAKLREAEAAAAAATEEDQAKAAAAVDAASKKVEAAQAAQVKAYANMQAAQDTATAKTEEAAAKRTAAEDAAAKQSVSSWDKQGKVAVQTGAVMGGAALAVGAGAVDMAVKFQTSTAKLVTSAGESDSAIGDVRQGLLTLAGDVGVSADQLSTDMYKVASAGYHGAAGLGLLKSAEQGAKAEGADGAKVADALSSALRDYYPHAQSAADVTKASADTMSKLIGATSAGKMTFDDLAGSLNSILPVASAAKINMSDVLGVLASMTVHGISADQATQNMADAIRHLQAPTQTMSKAMATLGVDSTDVANKLGERGLSGTMQYLSEKVKAAMPPGTEKVIIDLGNALSKSSPQVQELGQKLMDGTITMAAFSKEAKGLDPISAGQATAFETLAKSTHQIGNQMISGADVLQSYGGTMSKVMGDATGLKVALMTTGENAQYTNDAIKTVSGSTADASGNVKGWAEVQKNAGQSMAELTATVQSLGISLGTALLPMVKAAADGLKGFLDWASKNPAVFNAMVLGILAVAAAMGVLAIAMMASGIGETQLIIAGIVVGVMILGAAIGWLVTHWSEVTAFMQSVWGGFLNWCRSVIDGFVGWWFTVWDPIAAFFKSLWTGIVNDVKHDVDVFMSIWNPVAAVFTNIWNGIVTVAKWAFAIIYTAVVVPFVVAAHLLGNAFQWLYTNVWQPVWGMISAVARTSWEWILANVMKPIMDYIRVVASVYVWFWQNVIVPVWEGIKTAMRVAWDWILANVWNPIVTAIHTLSDAFTWFWQQIIVPVWAAIQKTIGDAWNWLYSNVVQGIQLEIKGLGIIFNWLHDNVIVPVWNGIQNAISTVWNWLSSNVFDPISRAIDGMSQGFKNGGDAIGKAWQTIQDAAKAPVKFVVDQVYNQGIRPVWNGVAGTVGLPQLDTVNLGFATGGIMPGYTPGRDVYQIAVSGGEAIMRPEWTRMIGAPRIHAMNAAAAHGDSKTVQSLMGFADGGIVGDIGNLIGGALNAIKDVALGGLKAAATPIVQGVESLADSSLGKTGFGGLLDAGVHKIGDGFLSFLGGKDASAPKASGSAGAIGSPGAVSGSLAQWVQAAMAAAGVSGSNWLNGLETIAGYESGGNPNAQNNWDVNAQNGDPSRGLMQTIGATFESYRLGSLPDNIFDPVANVAAAIRYIQSRYGDISNVPGLVSLAHGGGYQGYAGGGITPLLFDQGGYIPPGRSIVDNHTGQPERVLAPGQHAGIGSVTINVNSNASANDIANELGYWVRLNG